MRLSELMRIGDDDKDMRPLTHAFRTKVQPVRNGERSSKGLFAFVARAATEQTQQLAGSAEPPPHKRLSDGTTNRSPVSVGKATRTGSIETWQPSAVLPMNLPLLELGPVHGR